MKTSSEQTKNQNPSGRYSQQLGEIFSFFKTLAVFLGIAFLLRASVIEAFKIPSGSMIPTLKISDHILVSKLTYGFRLPFMTEMLYQYSTPKRGDIVVFTRPDDPLTTEDDSNINIIKRVIGTPGDTVEVSGTHVLINNQEIDEPYARWELGGIQNFGPQVVPPDHVFLMGDNRDHSKDGRFWSYPFLPIKMIKGRALIIYWTWDSDFFGRIGKIIR